MLTPGNQKLGGAGLIWGFGLPSRSSGPGRSPACAGPCYSARLEAFRPSLRLRYERNLTLSRKPNFARRVLAFLHRKGVRVVRLHTGGDFYPASHARKWPAVMRAARRGVDRRVPRVRPGPRPGPRP